MLNPGQNFHRTFTVNHNHTVPSILPEEKAFTSMPEVFTTGCLVASMELACIEHLNPHLDKGEMSLGIKMDLTHDAACTPGTLLDISATVTKVTNKTVCWNVRVVTHSSDLLIGKGSHTRAIVNRDKFLHNVNEQREAIGGQEI